MATFSDFRLFDCQSAFLLSYLTKPIKRGKVFKIACVAMIFRSKYTGGITADVNNFLRQSEVNGRLY